MNALPWLSLIIFTPWVGALLLAVLPKLGPAASRSVTLLFSLSTLALGLVAAATFDASTAGYQLVEQHRWIAALNVDYHLGLDGMSLLLVLLTGLVGPASVLASWRDDRDVRLAGLLTLMLQGAALGVFLALDFFPWFLFWELSLVPAFFLIKLWGGRRRGAEPDRRPDLQQTESNPETKAAYQFVIYTLAGSAFMLMGFAAIYSATGTLSFVQLTELAAAGQLNVKLSSVASFAPTAVFLGVFLGLAVKVPLFPFHSWLPAAYAEAPTGTSMFLTGVMSKMGMYGFLRLLWPLFPAQLQAAAQPLLWLAVAGVVFGAFAAMKQTDLKRLVAYSSLNHLSYCLLALFAVAGTGASNPTATTSALSGTLLQMFNHGLSAAALFFCVGALEARSGGVRGLNDFGGVRTAAPVFAGLSGFAMFSSLGLPGLNGFVGEFLIFRGVWGLSPAAAAVSCIGLLVTALFLLTFWQRVFHGPRAGVATAGFPDASKLEIAVLAPLALLMLLFGLLPQLLVGIFNPLVTAWASHLLP
jgi:NADH-quinone oxidoreductase subunit M